MDPWEEARKKYLAGLSDKERNMFTSANMENTLAEVTQAEKTHSKSSKSRAFIQKIQPLISAIDQYGKALDIISNTSSGILCPLWGSLRILLHISQEFQKYFDKLLEMLERIGDILPRYNTFAFLFKKHPSLQKALSSVYLDIITFCMDAKKVFTSSSTASSHVPSSGLRILSKLLWKPFDEQFGDVLDRFRRHRKLVEEEARLAEMVESAQERLNAGEERMRMSKERELANGGRETIKRIETIVDQQGIRERMAEIQKWIAPEFCDDEYERLQEIRLDGSCEWVLQKKEFEEWKNLSGTQILWVYGIPGCGKTFIFTKLFENLREDTAPAALFLCVNDDDRRNSTTSIIRSWTFQLLKQSPNAIEVVNRYWGGGDRPATQREVMNLLLKLLDSLPTCYLAIDGLDECNDRGDFIRFLQRVPRKHKILVVSREQNDIKSLFSTFSTRMARIKIEPENTNGDIDSYISERLATDFCMQEEHLNTMIRNRLLDCKGMFLWVRLMFDHLLMQTTIEELTDALDQLPTGLDETYDIVLNKINKLPDSQRILANRILMWVVTVHRPLTIAELRTALAIQPGDEKLDPRKLTINPQATILTLCGPLIEIVEPSKVVNTIHFTVNQYLVRYLEESRILPEIAVHYSRGEFESAHSLIAATCVTYLGFSVIGEIQPPSNCHEAIALSEDSSPDMALLSYASLNWFLHVRQTTYADIPLHQVVKKFLDSRRRNLGVWWCTYWFSGKDSFESRRCPSQFSPVHVAAYLGLEKVVQSLSDEKATLLFDSYHRTPLWWAVSMKHLPTVTVLLELGLDPKAPDNDLITPLHRAATGGDTNMLYPLLCNASSTYRDCKEPIADAEGWTPLHWAVSRGNIHAVEYLLGNFKSIVGDVYSTTSDGRTPLHLAALSGHFETIKILLGSFRMDWDGLYHGRKDCIDAQDHSGLTALHMASKQGHISSVQILNYYGADARIRDAAGKTAEQYARLMGHEKVELLLSQNGGFAEDQMISRKELVLRVARTLTEHGLVKTQKETDDTLTTNSRDSQDSSLLEACITGHYRTLLSLSRKRILPIGKRDDRGRNNLHHAAAGGYENCVKMILRIMNNREGRIDEGDINGWTALHYATASGSLGVVKRLVDRGANINLTNNAGKTPFDIASEEGYQGIMECLAKAPAPPSSNNEMAAAFQWSQLHLDARSGNLAGIECAIQHGWDLSPKDRFGRIPLVRAAEMGQLTAVQMLTKASAPSVEEVWDSLDLATISGHEDIIEFLLQYLPLDSLNSDKGRSVSRHLLFWATERGRVPIIKRLHELGLSFELQNNPPSLNTALHIAVERGDTDLVKFLVENGADTSAVNSKGETALHLAASEDQREAVTILLNSGADINSLTPDVCYTQEYPRYTSGATPLHIAVKKGNTEVIEILLQNGADATISNAKGTTALSKAQSRLWKSNIWGSWADSKVKTMATFEILKRYRPQLIEKSTARLKTPFQEAVAACDTQAVIKALMDIVWGELPSDTELTAMNFQNTNLLNDALLYCAMNGGHIDIVELLLNIIEKSQSGLIDSDLKFLAETARSNGNNTISQALFGRIKTEANIC